MWRGFAREWNLAEYVRSGWVRLDGGALRWDATSRNLLQERRFPVINVPPGTLLASYVMPETKSGLAERLVALFRARSVASAVAVWRAKAAEVGPDARERETFLAAACALAATDLEEGTTWRGIELTSALTAALTPESVKAPAVSLACLNLARWLIHAGAEDAKLDGVRQGLLSRLRDVASRDWFAALSR